MPNLSDDIQYSRELIADWPDGSKLEVDKFRGDPIAPWAYGTYEGYCGTCKDAVADDSDRGAVHLELLGHLLMHAQEEITNMRSRVFRRAT